MATRWARVVRGLLTASVAVLVAALSHSAAGTNTPGFVGTSIALAFAAIVCVALAGTKLSLPKLTLSVGVSQLLFHALFALGGTPSTSMSETGHHGTVVMGAADTASALSASALSASVAATSGQHDMGWMWVAHSLAAVITIIALRRGEQSFWSLLDFARLALVSIVRSLTIIVTLPRQRAHVLAMLTHRFVATDLHVLLSPMRHRGPPVTCSAL